MLPTTIANSIPLTGLKRLVITEVLLLRGRWLLRDSLLILLHRDQRSDVTAANRARLLVLHETLSARLAHAEVTARHNQCVFRVGQTNQALGVGVVIDDLMPLLSALLLRHSVNRLQLEGQTVNLVNAHKQSEARDEGYLRGRLA